MHTNLAVPILINPQTCEALTPIVNVKAPRTAFGRIISSITEPNGSQTSEVVDYLPIPTVTLAEAWEAAKEERYKRNNDHYKALREWYALRKVSITGDPLACPPRAPRFNQEKPEDVEWCKRQTTFRNIAVRAKRSNDVWCKTCVERTVMTTPDGEHINTTDRRGMYVEQVHECGPTIVALRVKGSASRNPTPTAQAEDVIEDMIALVKIGVQKEHVNGGRRVSTQGCSGSENDCVAIDYCSRDSRAKQHEHAPVDLGRPCLRCGEPVLKRKGTKYCSDNCTKRASEERMRANVLSREVLCQ